MGDTDAVNMNAPTKPLNRASTHSTSDHPFAARSHPATQMGRIQRN